MSVFRSLSGLAFLGAIFFGLQEFVHSDREEMIAGGIGVLVAMAAWYLFKNKHRRTGALPTPRAELVDSQPPNSRPEPPKNSECGPPPRRS